MTSTKQIAANRLNSLKSTGPRTAHGKRRSRQNAVIHGLTAKTVITALENASDYQAFETIIAADYQPRSATEALLVTELVSVLWRLRRSTRIETDLFEIQGELMRHANRDRALGKPLPLPEWYDELDTSSSSLRQAQVEIPGHQGAASPQTLAYCFLRMSRLGFGPLDLLNRYETTLWRRAAQLFLMLQSAVRR